MNYLYCLIFDEMMVMVISDLMILNDDDENLLKQDDSLLVVLVHVLQLFVVAILFDDFETMSKISIELFQEENKNEF